LRSIVIYTLVVTAIYLVAMHLSHLILGHIERLPLVYAKLPFTLPLVIAFSVIGIVVMRVVHFIGPETLFHLTVGTYHRPVLEKKMLMFIDMNDSTALDDMRREGSEYERLFGLVPRYRIGVHGGDVVVSEQGDTKRAIGVYGDTINIAARMEEAAKAYGVGCVLSGQAASGLAPPGERLVALGNERIKGISAPMEICEYRFTAA